MLKMFAYCIFSKRGRCCGCQVLSLCEDRKRQPGEDVKTTMRSDLIRSALKRMFSNQGDSTMIESYNNREMIAKQPIEKKTPCVYEFLTTCVLPLQCIHEKDEVYEGILSGESWKQVIQENTKSHEFPVKVPF
jgi:hypothetical protein